VSRVRQSSFTPSHPPCTRPAAAAAVRAAARSAVETLEDRRHFAIDLFPPFVADIDAPDVDGTPTQFVVQVTYADDVAIDEGLIDETDLTITGPGGTLPVRSVEHFGSATSLTALYTVGAPEGGFNASNSGRYSITVNAGAVKDLDGKSNLPASESFNVGTADTQGPVGAITIGAITPAGATVRIDFTDDGAIDPATLGTDDITVTGPNGTLVVSDFDPSGSGSSVAVTYTVDAPGGAWSSADTGQYTVTLNAGAVADASENTNARKTKTFAVDATGPSASAAAPNISSRAGAGDDYQVTVVYEDEDNGVAEGSVGLDDITVTGPGGPLTVSDKSISSSDGGKKLTVTYTVGAPGGSWDETDNGEYAVIVNAGAVTDSAGNGSQAGGASFSVNIPAPDAAAPTAAIAVADVASVKTNHAVKITFTDDRGIDPATIGTDDIAVSGPGGAVNVSGVSLDRQDGGRRYVATYTLAGPNGHWDGANNGTYTVALAAGAVADTSGNTVAADAKEFVVNIPAPDVDAPTASINSADVTNAGAATHTVRVTYTDNRNVRESTIGTGDVRVTGPGGAALQVSAVSTQPDENSRTIVATYTIAAPGGSWDPSENGTYTIEVLAGEVNDTSGNGVAATSATFAVDARLADGAAPTATVAAADVTAAGASSHTVVVTYTDDAAVDPNSIGADDITVTGPAGTLTVGTVVLNASDNGRTIVATYTINAPAGGWSYTHNGTYAVVVNGSAVSDQSGKGIASSGGTFAVAVGAPQPVDTSWGGGSGNVNTGFVGEAVATTNDGKILVAGREGDVGSGNARAVLQRLSGAGEVDTTFGQGGRVVTGGANEAFFAVLTQGDKILVSGTTDGNFLLARYNADGSPDATFASGGRAVVDLGADDDSVYGMALAPDGKIVVTGGSGGNFAFARFTADGAPDLTFDQGGKTLLDLNTASDVPGAVAVQGDGKIVATGSSGANVAVVRLLASGLPDASFSDDGLVMVEGLKASEIANFNDRSQALALQADGKILIANHTAAGDTAVARLDSAGNLDGAFGVNGISTVDFAGDDDADAIILQNTGEIMVVGTSLQNGIARTTIAALSQSGKLIEGFGQGGKLVFDALPGGPERELHVGDLVVRSFGTKQNDGRIVVGTSNQAPNTTTSALKRLIVPGSAAAPSGSQIGSFGLVNGKNTKLVIDAGGGKFVTFTMKGGNASVFQDGDAYSLLLNDDGRGAAVTVKVKGGDRRVKLGDISTSGSIKTFSAKTGDLSGTLTAGIQIGRVTLGDVTGKIIAGGSIAGVTAANLRGAFVLAGTGLGSDRQLGGLSADADTFATGFIGSISVKGEIAGSTIGAGLNPIDGTYGDDDDTVVGGSGSYIKSISARLGADDSSKFVAGAFKKVKLGKGKIDLATDARFKTIA
jgi:uncharacterized delta-60 repeat protein